MAVTSFTITPTSGYVYGTQFTAVNILQNVSLLRNVWDFGDGSNLNYDQQPTHTYQYPGIYTVTLSTIDTNGNVESYNSAVTVDYLYRDYIYFTSIPENYSNPGKQTPSTFKFDIVSSQITSSLKVNLFAVNSNSLPYEQFKDYKWNFLIPTWKFLDKNNNIVTSLDIAATPLYHDNKIVGVSGTGEFYYTDNTSTGDPEKNCPVLITATLETSGLPYKNDSFIYNHPGYANNKSVTSGVVWFVNDLTPDLLKITGNYIDNIHPLKWVDVKIPTMITCHSSLANKLQGGSSDISEILFTYPGSNEFGKLASVFLTLQNSNNSFTDTNQEVENAPLFFQKTDNDGNDTGGIIFTSLKSSITSDSTTAFSQTTAYIDYTDYYSQSFPYPGALAPQPAVWVSNPSQNTLNKITLLPYPENCDTISYYKNNKLLVDGYIRQVDVPSIKINNTFNYSMSGFSGIYSMAIDPRNYDLIAADGEKDCIYKYNTAGTLISTLNLSSVLSFNPIEEGVTPASICLDKNYNIWTSLFNSVSVLKFDKDFNLLLKVVPQYFFNINDDYEYIFDGDFVNKPPVLQTDKNNNCWVAYSHPLCSMLIQYEPEGELITNIILPINSAPVDLAINADNNLWVANSYNTTKFLGNIQLYNTSTYELISSFDGFTRPSYLALDRYNNVWFTHNIKDVGFINSKTGELKLWSVNYNSSTVTFNSLPVPYYIQPDDEQLDETIGGFAVDVYNRVWYIDSYRNIAWTVSASANIESLSGRAFKIRPDSTIGYYTDIKTHETIIDVNENYKSAQAFGDWTGNQWYQKYTNILTFSAVPVSGISTEFYISPFQNNYEIRKINDSFNTADYFYSLALPEILKNNTTLFTELLPAVIGDASEDFYQDPGREVYEKIANFTINHADVDTCNIKQLISLAEQTATPHSNYSLDLPSDIKKILDLTSISRTKLWGMKDMNPILKQSIGDRLNTFTDYITADTFIILLNKFDASLSLVKVPALTSGIFTEDYYYRYEATYTEFIPTTVYPLSVFEGPEFIQPVLENYLFYNFNGQYSDEFIENIIDWNSEFTTLTPQQSTYEEWFGDNGIVEKNFNYYLTKNLVE